MTALTFGFAAREQRSGVNRHELFGHQVVDCIGQGAGSTIYTVRHATDRKLYALKHVLRSTEKDCRFVAQLEAEHEVGQLLRHPGLRRTVELHLTKNLLFKVTEAALLMEWVDGRPLEFARPSGVAAQLQVFVATAAALDALHALGYVHCDLKPNNILLGPDGKVKVIDLGQAARVGTVKQRIQGTPDYISPEQVQCGPVTVRTDVFNLGATMYWSLTGGRKLPTLYTVQQKENSFLLDAKIDPPHELNPAVPEPLSNLVMQCARTNPQKRPADMKELIARLETIHHALTRRAPAARNSAAA